MIRNLDLFNPELLSIFAVAGHGDLIAITDRGFPLPKNMFTRVADLGVSKNIPRVMDIIKPALKMVSIESLILSEEIHVYNPEFVKELEAAIIKEDLKIPLTYIPHALFKAKVLQNSTENAPFHGFIRTGECTKYTNVIIVCGVSF